MDQSPLIRKLLIPFTYRRRNCHLLGFVRISFNKHGANTFPGTRIKTWDIFYGSSERSLTTIDTTTRIDLQRLMHKNMFALSSLHLNWDHRYKIK